MKIQMNWQSSFNLEGKKYLINELSKEIKESIKALQIAETQLKCTRTH